MGLAARKRLEKEQLEAIEKAELAEMEKAYVHVPRCG
jgi:hypothetical protein